MRLTVEIGGREAIPLRAIPLTTDWESMHPEEIADALADPGGRRPAFRGLRAYYLEDGKAIAFQARWWDSSVRWQLRELKAQLQEHDAAGPMAVTEAGQRWQHHSLALLPAGAFVWLDEFEPLYMAAHGGEAVTWVDGSLDASDRALDEDPEAWDEALGEAANDRAALNFERHIETPELRALIAEAVAAITLAPHGGSYTALAPAAAQSHKPSQADDAPTAIAPASTAPAAATSPADAPADPDAAPAPVDQAPGDAPAPAVRSVAPIPDAPPTSSWPAKKCPPSSHTAAEPKASTTSVAHKVHFSSTDVLSEVLATAQQRSADPLDTTVVWIALQQLAEQEIFPLKGADEEGIKYLKNGEPAWFTKDHLRDRLRTQRKKLKGKTSASTRGQA